MTDKDDESINGQAVTNVVLPMLMGPAFGIIAGIAVSALRSLIVTNHESTDLTGKTELHPSEKDTTISKSETTADKKKASLNDDTVAGINGELEASGTKGAANNNGAGALNTEGKAVETEGGALNASTQALQT